MKFKAREIAIVAITVITVIVALMLRNYFDSPEYYFKQQRRMVDRVLAANPNELLMAGRQMLERHPNFVGELSPNSQEIPDAIRQLNPTRITFHTNRVSVDFSDAFNPFGIVVLRAGTNGVGMHKWIDGLWVYDDGQLHDRLKSDGSFK